MAVEIKEKRTRNSKTYHLGGRKYAWDGTIGAIHYKDNYADKSELWKDIDLTWEGNRITKAPYELTLEGKKLTIRDKESGEVSTIELLESTSMGIAWQIIPEFTSVRFQHILPSDKVPFEAKFKVTGKIPFRTRAWDDEGELPLETTLKDGILTEKLSLLPRPVKGNIRIDPTWQVGTSADDAIEYGDGTFSYTLWSLYIASNTNTASSSYRCVGARFQNITIPSGASIGTAYQEVYAWATSDDINTDVFGNDVDNAADFATTGVIIDTGSRPRTAASVSMVQDNVGQFNWIGSAIEIKAIIQEIIDRGGWASGNAIVLLYIAKTDVDKFFGVDNYDNVSANAPKLYIEYTVGGVNYDRFASVIVGVVASASKATAISAASLVLIGIATTATRALAITRSSSVIIGIVVTASKVWNRVKQVATAIGVVVSGGYGLARALIVKAITSQYRKIKGDVS